MGGEKYYITSLRKEILFDIITLKLPLQMAISKEVLHFQLFIISSVWNLQLLFFIKIIFLSKERSSHQLFYSHSISH